MDVFNDDHYESLRRKVVANARAIISFEVGLPLGCVRMSRLFHWIKPRQDFAYPVFDSYLDAVCDLAIGQDRLQWNRQALIEQDIMLGEINAKYHDDVLNACFGLIDELKD